MAIYKHLVRLPWDSGLPTDVTVNVFHSDSVDDTEAAGFSDALVTFYGAIDTHLASILDNNVDVASVTAYALADPEPRAPRDVELFTITSGATTTITEAAICMSFQAAQVSGQPQARRRGRVFLGPLGSVIDGTVGRPTTIVVDAIRDAGAALLAASGGAGVGVWGVYSPTNDDIVPVDNGWVDNEFDTVRSRGRVATSRDTF